MNENNTIIVMPNMKCDEEKFTIYNFLKEHHTILIASISGFITALSFIISMIAYLNQITFLKKWNIPVDSVEDMVQNRFVYYFAVSIVLSAFTMWSQEIIKRKYRLYYSYSADMKYLRCELKYLQRDNDGNKENQSIHLKRKIKLLKQQIRIYLIWLNAHLLLLAIIYSLILLPLWLIVSSFAGEINYSIIISVWIAFCIINFLSARAETIMLFEPYTPKRIKKIVKKTHDKNEDPDGFLDTMHSYFNRLQTPNSFQSVFSDENIKRFLSSIFISMLFFCVSIIVFADMTTIKEMWIYSDDDKTYAVVYQNEKQTILEEARIFGNQLVIYTNKIKYLSSDNLEIEKIKFESIIMETQTHETERKEFMEDSWTQASI